MFTSMVLVNHHHLVLVIKLIQGTLKQGSREGGDLLEVLILTLDLPCFSGQQCEHSDSFLKNFTMNCVFFLRALFFKCSIQFSLQALFFLLKCLIQFWNVSMHCFKSFIWFFTHTWAVIRALGSRKDVRNSCFNVGWWQLRLFCYKVLLHKSQDPWFICFAFTKILKVLLSKSPEILLLRRNPPEIWWCFCARPVGRLD